MSSEMLLGMINNAAFLLVLAIMYDILPSQEKAHSRFQEVFSGVLISCIGIAVMLLPWRFSEGVIFDTRSILLSLTGLFFGVLPTTIVVAMTTALRISQGGSGVWMGICVIWTSAGLGLAWRYRLKDWSKLPRWYEFYVFGLIVHAAMLGWTSVLPREISLTVLRTIALPVMVIYPVSTVLLGLQFVRHYQRRLFEQQLRYERDLIRQMNAELEQRVEKRTQQLEEAQAQLIQQEKLAVLGKLANSVGHELRNPLGNIYNAVYLLNLVQPDADGQIKEYLELIQHEARAADKIITDLLDFARVKSCDPEPIAVAELIHQVLERYPAPEGVQIAQVLAPDLPRVYVDPRHLIQVLGNLVLNAYQAMPEGGMLSVHGSQPPATDQVQITIQDTGAGIPPENIPHLFEPLFTTKARGIGLGLAVARKLTQANGGTIEVQSEPGKGSIFTVNVPNHEVKR